MTKEPPKGSADSNDPADGRRGSVAPVVPIRPLPPVVDIEDEPELESGGFSLPEPGSPLLLDLGLTGAHTVIYALLYDRRSNPPTMLEIRDHIFDILGEAQSQTDRRVRDLRKYFVIRAEQKHGEWRYRLTGWRARPEADAPAISLRTRAVVLAPQRCAQCGRTPLEDGVKLAVDHRIPRSWGGGDEPENLQPLCVDCNAGKKDFYASYNAHAEQIRASINYDEPHVRIGELLKAFEGGWVSTDLISIVASSKQFQEDYQKRTRELRVLGWDIRAQKRHHEGARIRVYYRAALWEPWPPPPVAAAIRAIERANKERKAQAKRDAAAALAKSSNP